MGIKKGSVENGKNTIDAGNHEAISKFEEIIITIRKEFVNQRKRLAMSQPFSIKSN